jgi:hypothetical protein
MESLNMLQGWGEKGFIMTDEIKFTRLAVEHDICLM